MTCPSCGTRLSKGAPFCHLCYTVVGAPSAPPTASSAAAATTSPLSVALSVPATAIASQPPRAAHRPRTARLVVAGGLTVVLSLVALLQAQPWESHSTPDGASTKTVSAIALLSGTGSRGRWRLGDANGATSVTSAQAPGCNEGPCPGTMTVRFSDGRTSSVNDEATIAAIGQVGPAHYLAVAGFCSLNCVVRVYGIDTGARAVTTVLDRAHPNPNAPGNPWYFPMPEGACGFTLTYQGATYTVRTVPDKGSSSYMSWLLYGGDTACPSRGRYATVETAREAAETTATTIQHTPTVNGLGPMCLALAGPGRLLIGDSASYVVWLANLTGRPVTLYGQTIAAGGIAPVAGKGGTGFSGDGGPATKAALYIQGCSLAVDKATNLYIADTGNYRVREVDARTGTIRTVAGGAAAQGTAGIHPLSIALSRGALLVDDFDHARILALDLRSGAMTTRAMLPSSARAIAADSAGNLFVSAGNHILKIDAAGVGATTTVAGNGTLSQGYTSAAVPATDGPIDASSIVIDHAGNLLLSDDYLRVIRKVDLSAGTIATVVGVAQEGPQGGFSGDGLATHALLDSPSDLAIDGAGNLLIADTGNHRVRLVNARTGRITTVVGPTGRH